MNEKELDQRLRMLGKEIPREQKLGAIKKEDVMAPRRANLEEYLRKNHNKLSPEQRASIERRLQSKAMNTPQEVVDEKKAAEIERRMEAVVKRKIERGELPDPNSKEIKDRYNKFMSSRPNV